MSFLYEPLAIVDLETTGTHAALDRITEIAVLEVDGLDVASEWSTLVNPGKPIPGEIQALTGISAEMVQRAPRFADLAEALYERLAGRLFVAHNARFDYGFLRREFERAGFNFQAKTVCTVRLSRRLYPREPRHDLDSVIARHGIECRARHRALGDADALLQFLRLAVEEHGEEVVAVAARQVAKHTVLPPHLDRAMIDEVPEAAGVYLLYGESLLYVGKSRNMRSRILQHFSSAATWPARVQRIEWQRTAGELGALLREARLVKELAPEFNRRLRRPHEIHGFVFDGTRLRLARCEELEPDAAACLIGPWRSRAAALKALRALADEHRLCLQALGFESRCFRRQIARCAGVCAGAESIHAHQGRLAAALAPLKAAEWPHRGALGVVETDHAREATEVHVVSRWCYLGTAQCDADVAELLEGERKARFDYDHYRILARHLARPGVRVVPLPA
jgi:DNA polymerase III subunit epsilon